MGILIRNLRLNKAETIICIILLLGIAGFILRHLDQAIYDMREPQLLSAATQTVPFGETLSLTYREVGQVSNYILWNGIVEMSLQKATLYPSYTAAKIAHGNISNPNRMLRDESLPFLVVEVQVRNIDADEGSDWWYQTDTSLQGISDSDGAVSLTHSFLLETRDEYLHSSLGYTNGMPIPQQEILATIPCGETVHITLGFSLKNYEEGYLNEAALIYASRQDRMDIGTPAMEDMTNEQPVQQART